MSHELSTTLRETTSPAGDVFVAFPVAADWLLRSAAPLFLRSAGFDHLAHRLAALREITPGILTATERKSHPHTPGEPAADTFDVVAEWGASMRRLVREVEGRVYAAVGVPVRVTWSFLHGGLVCLPIDGTPATPAIHSTFLRSLTDACLPVAGSTQAAGVAGCDDPAMTRAAAHGPQHCAPHPPSYLREGVGA